MDARRQCGPTQYARICGGRPRPIHSLTPACSNQRAPMMLARDLVGQIRDLGVSVSTSTLRSVTAIPSVVDARNLAIGFCGVDFADLDETKMRLPGTIA